MTAPVVEPVEYIDPGFPYLTWIRGVRPCPDDERDFKDVRYPITGGLCDGYAVGGRL